MKLNLRRVRKVRWTTSDNHCLQNSDTLKYRFWEPAMMLIWFQPMLHTSCCVNYYCQAKIHDKKKNGQ